MNDAERCAHCFCRFDQHGAENNPHRPFACPAGPGFPKYPKIKDHQRASELFDKRLKRHWTVRTTSFQRVP